MTVSSEFAMDVYYTQDRLQEIWKQIGSLHLSYLELEESPQKLQQRTKLEDYIREFLCLAPHNQKFIFRETSDVLHRSASIKKDFSGYRAALGWNAIGMYAANLLNQPWRKEYKQIQLYSGFYKHQIDANLVGAEIIFEVMGYKRNGDGILILDGPICPDRVISVSQDALIAYVECQVLKSIWEEVSVNFKISWLEVLEFRETHLCSTKQSVQALNYRFHERQFQQHTRSYSQGTDPFMVNARLLGNAHQSNAHSAHSFPPLHTHAAMSSTPCIYGTNNYYNTCPTYAPLSPQHYAYHMPLTCNQTVGKPIYHPSNCYSNGYIVPPPPYICSAVPTAQLIEVESQGSHHYDTVDGNGHSRTDSSSKNNLKSNSDKEDINSDTIDNWDFVYRDLESQGYSKDLGERGDVLTSPIDSKKSKNVVKEAKRIEAHTLEGGINNLNMTDKVSRTNYSLQQFKDREKDASELIDERDLNSQKQTARHSVNGFLKINNSIPTVEKIAVNSTIDRSSNIKTLDVKKQKQNQASDRISPKGKQQSTKEIPKADESKWQCTTCTYLNNLSHKICDMCGKSKVKVQDTMEIGGSQCSKCTLVNPKDNKICSACSSSLKDSPTYI